MIPTIRRMLFTSCPARGAINMKDPSTSVLQDRFRPLATGHVGSAPVHSVDGQLHQHERPRGVEVIHFSISRNNNERQTCRKVAAFSRPLLSDDAKHSPVPLEQPFSK